LRCQSPTAGATDREGIKAGPLLSLLSSPQRQQQRQQRQWWKRPLRNPFNGQQQQSIDHAHHHNRKSSSSTLQSQQHFYSRDFVFTLVAAVGGTDQLALNGGGYVGQMRVYPRLANFVIIIISQKQQQHQLFTVYFIHFNILFYS